MNEIYYLKASGYKKCSFVPAMGTKRKALAIEKLLAEGYETIDIIRIEEIEEMPEDYDEENLAEFIKEYEKD